MRYEAEKAMTPLRPRGDVAAQRLDNETVLVNLRTNNVYTLNGTGARIWELVGEGLDREAVLRRLGEEFDVAPEQLAQEVDALLAELAAEGLLDVAE